MKGQDRVWGSHVALWTALLGVVLPTAALRSSALLASPEAPRTLPSNRPNILLLVSDDQTWANFTRDLMPNVFSELVDTHRPVRTCRRTTTTARTRWTLSAHPPDPVLSVDSSRRAERC